MKPFTVTVITAGTRYSFNAIAQCWFAAWSEAVDTFGVAALVIIKPVRGN